MVYYIEVTDNIKSEVDNLTKKIVDKFGIRIYGILHMGSSVLRHFGYKDIDIMVIFQDKETMADLESMRRIINKFPYILDLHVISLQTIKDGRDYSLYTHGQFFVEYLKKARLCYGTNPFENIRLPNDIVRTSIKQKLQYFYCRAQMFFLSDKYGNNVLSVDEFLFHKKKILLMLVDYWLAFSGKPTNIYDCDFVTVLNSLGQYKIYRDNKELFDDDKYVEYKFSELVNIYNSIYFSAIEVIDGKETN